VKIPIPLTSTLCTDSTHGDIVNPLQKDDRFDYNASFYHKRLLTNARKETLPPNAFLTTDGRIIQEDVIGSRARITEAGKLIAEVDALGVVGRENIQADDVTMYGGDIYYIVQTTSGYDIVNKTAGTRQSYTQAGILQVRFVKNTILPIVVLQNYSVVIDGNTITDSSLVSWFNSIQITELVAVQIGSTIYFTMNGSYKPVEYSNEIGYGIIRELVDGGIKYSWDSYGTDYTYKFYYGVTSDKEAATVITEITTEENVCSVILPKAHWYIWLETYQAALLLGVVGAAGPATDEIRLWRGHPENRVALFSVVPGTQFAAAVATVTAYEKGQTGGFYSAKTFSTPAFLTNDLGSLFVPDYTEVIPGYSDHKYSRANAILVYCYESTAGTGVLRDNLGPLYTEYDEPKGFVWKAQKSGTWNLAGQISGQMLAPYCRDGANTWVIIDVPKRNSGASYGAPNEWQAIFDLQTQAYIPGVVKNIIPWNKGNIINAEIVDCFIGMGFIAYMICYSLDNEANLFWKEVNYDSRFMAVDYTSYQGVIPPLNSAVGQVPEETSVKQFNGSVLAYNNIRLNYIKDSPQSISYTKNQNSIGVLLAPYGEVEDNVPVQFINNTLIYKTTGGYSIIKLGTDIQDRVTKIANYVYAINTIDVKNIIVELEGIGLQLEYGSLDWNNKVELILKVPNIGDPTVNYYHVNTAYNANYEVTGKRSASYIGDDLIVPLGGILDYSKSGPGYYTIMLIHADGVPIDIYYSGGSNDIRPTYRYTQNGNSKQQDSMLNEITFPDGIIVPYPVGIEWDQNNEIYAVSRVSIETTAIGLVWENKTIAAYLYEKNVYYGKNIFLLYGVMYIFDGNDIYLLDTMERVCHAFGYTFLGVDTGRAYFYSKWDKAVYVFNGSRDLSYLLDMSNKGEIINSMYDSYSNELIMLTKDDILIVKNGQMLSFPNPVHDRFFRTIYGTWTYGGAGAMRLSPDGDGAVEHFRLRTEYFGVDGSTVCKYDRFDIRLYSQSRKKAALKIRADTINQGSRESDEKTVEIKSLDWSNEGYKTIQIVPKYQRGQGCALEINSDDLIAITNIELYMDEAERVPVKRSLGV
jgi:hypothetical protein